MKLIKSRSFLFMFMFVSMFCSIAVFADEPPKLGEAILGLIDAIKVGGAGVILAAVVQVLKSDTAVGLLAKVNSKYIPWITLVIAVAGNVAHGLVTKSESPVWVLIVEGILISFASSGIFDMFKAKNA